MAALNASDRLAQFVSNHYTETEFAELCRLLSVDSGVLPSDPVQRKTMALVNTCFERGILADLLLMVKQQHPEAFATSDLDAAPRYVALLEGQIVKNRQESFRQNSQPQSIPRQDNHRSGSQKHRRWAIVLISTILLVTLAIATLTQLLDPLTLTQIPARNDPQIIGQSGNTDGPLIFSISLQEPSALTFVAVTLVAWLAILAGVAQITGYSIRDLIPSRSSQPIEPDFPFYIIHNYEELVARLFPNPTAPVIPDSAVPYLSQIAAELDEAFNKSNFILIAGKSKVGKTREGAELIRRWLPTNSTILLAQSHIELRPPSSIPPDLAKTSVILFLDDIDQYCTSKEAVENIAATIEFFNANTHYGFKIVATVRQEPSVWQKLRYDSAMIWSQFYLISLPMVSQDTADLLLQRIAERYHLHIPELIRREIARKNDGTFLNIVVTARSWLIDNLFQIDMQQVDRFQSSLALQWRKRYDQLIQDYPETGPVYAAIHTLQDLNVPLHCSFITQLAAAMNVNFVCHVKTGLTIWSKYFLFSSLPGRPPSQIPDKLWNIGSLFPVLWLLGFAALLVGLSRLTVDVDFLLGLESLIFLIMAVFQAIVLSIELYVGIKLERLDQFVEMIAKNETPISQDVLHPYDLQFSQDYLVRTWSYSQYQGTTATVASRVLLNPQLGLIFSSLALSLLEKGQITSSVVLARRASEFWSKNSVPYYVFGVSAFHHQKYEEALLCFQQCRRLANWSDWGKISELMTQCQYEIEMLKEVSECANSPTPDLPDYGGIRSEQSLALPQQDQTEIGRSGNEHVTPDRNVTQLQAQHVSREHSSEHSTKNWDTSATQKIIIPPFWSPYKDKRVLRVKTRLVMSITLFLFAGILAILGLPNVQFPRIFDNETIVFALRSVEQLQLPLYHGTAYSAMTRGYLYLTLRQPELAIAEFNTVTKLAPDSFWGYWWRGSVYFAMGRYDGALKDYTRVVALLPNDKRGYTGRGDAYRALYKYDDALAEYDKLVAKFPKETEGYSGRAAVYRSLNKYNQALAEYDKMVAQFPNETGGYFGRAEVYSAMREYNQALAEYDKMVAQFPNETGGYSGRAEIYSAMGEYNQALAEYNKMVAQFPNETGGYSGRAEVYSAMGEYNQALAEYDKMVAQFPYSGVGYRGRAEVYRALYKYDEALAEYDKVVAKFPEWGVGYWGRAEVYRALYKYDEALAEYDKLVAKFPDLDWGYSGRAEVYRAIGEYDQAMAEYDKLVAKFPDWSVGYSGRAEVYRAMGEYDQALVEYDKWVAQFPNETGGYVGRAEVYRALYRYDEALANYDRLVAQFPDSSLGYWGRAEVYRALYKYDEALANYDRLVAQFPDWNGGYWGRAEVYRALYKYDEALAEYDKVVAKFPDLNFGYSGRVEVYRALYKYDEALVEYDKLVAQFPNETRWYSGRAEIYRSLYKYVEALAEYDKVVTRFPDSSVGYWGRAEVYRALYKYDEALAEYNKLVAKFPALDLGYSGRIEVYRALHKYDKAWAEYDKMVAQFPNETRWYSGRAELHRALYEYDEALVEYDKMVAQFPSETGGYSGRAEVYRAMGEYDQAMAEYDKLVAKFPNETGGYSGRAEVYRAIGEYDQAMAEYDKTALRFPYWIGAYNPKARVYRATGEFDKALAEYDKLVAKFPDLDLGYSGRAEVYHAQYKYDKALAEYDKLVAKFPGGRWGYSGRAQVYRDQHRYDEAKAEYDKMVTKFPDWSWGYSGRAQVYRALYKYDEALAEYDKMVAQFPNETGGYSGRAEVLRAQYKYDEALAEYDRMARLFPLDLACHFGRIEIYLATGKYNEALAEYGKAIAVNRYDPRLYASRGYTYLRMGKSELAFAEFEKSFRLDPLQLSNTGLAMAYWWSGKHTSALLENDRLLKVHDASMSFWLHASRAYIYQAMNRDDLAIDIYSNAIQDAPSDPHLISKRADAYSIMGSHELALIDYDKALSIDSSSVYLYLGRALVYRALGEFELGLVDYNTVGDIVKHVGPLSKDALVGKGNTYRQMDQLTLALSQFNDALEEFPNEPTVHYGRGNVLREMGDLYQAKSEFDRALRTTPYASILYVGRGIVSRELGQTDAALTDLSEALRLDIFSDTGYYERGITYRENGQLERSLQDLNRAISIPDQHQFADYLERGITYIRMGQYELALADLNSAIERRPQYPIAYYHRSMVYRELGNHSGEVSDIAILATLMPKGISEHSPKHFTKDDQRNDASLEHIMTIFLHMLLRF